MSQLFSELNSKLLEVISSLLDVKKIPINSQIKTFQEVISIFEKITASHCRANY